MNRFRTRRRAKESDADSVSSSSHGKLKKGGKRAPSPPRPQIDLSSALPPSDDFRTSLLMSTLTARFSMLREQDDPNSKLGKANDDSVLFPKRSSRLGDFGFSPTAKLSDIAEDASIDGSIRPPFVYGRSTSFASDGYATDEDNISSSVMGRSRPGEGNNLFGGRQKVYKIPVTGSASGVPSEAPDGHVTGRTMGGKLIYENDISMSAFQKLREKERLEREANEAEFLASGEQFTRERNPSPPLSGYNRNRETASSTTSGPSGRTSTAATSIASQGASSIRGGPSRNREESLPNFPAGGMPLPSAMSLERTKSRRLYEHGLDRQLQDQQSSSMTRLDQISRQRALGGTPPPGLNSSLTHTSSATNLHERFERSGMQYGSRPASPPSSEPSTAVGAFDFGLPISKPSSPITGPNPRLPLSPPVSEGESSFAFPSNGMEKGKTSNLGLFARPSQDYDEEQYSERQIQMQQGRNTPTKNGSPPATANGTPSADRSRSDSDNRRKAVQLTGYSPIEPIRKTGHLESPQIGGYRDFGKSQHSPVSFSDKSSHGESEAEGEKILSEFDAAPRAGRTAHGEITRPDDADHPAFRKPAEITSTPHHAQKASRGSAKSIHVHKDRKGSAATLTQLMSSDGDSPTLGPAMGLSGLVRQHLRSDSGSSSNYGMPSPVTSKFFSDDYTVGKESRKSASHSLYAGGNPWGPDDDDVLPNGLPPSSPPTMPAPLSTSSTTRSGLSQHPQSPEQFGSKKSQPEHAPVRDINEASTKPPTHPTFLNNPSAFRRTPPVGSSSSGLPLGAPHNEQIVNGSPMPRARNGEAPQSSFNRPREANGSETYWKQEEDRMHRSIVRGPKPPGPVIPSPQARRQERRAQEPRFRGMNDTSKAISANKPAPPPERVGAQEHSGLGVDLNPSGQPGNNTTSLRREPLEQSPRKQVDQSKSQRATPQHSPPSSRGQLGNPGRARSDSKSSAPAYFDRSLQPLQTSGMNAASSTRPSPLTPFSANSTPPLDDPVSGGSNGGLLPSNPQGFQGHSAIPRNRKKSINKADISEPTLTSSTYTMTTVNLPPGASLSNGSESSQNAPPVPPINPRRRRPTAQAVMQVFGAGRSEKRISPPMATNRSASEERSAFDSDEGDDLRSRYKARIRKISSDGGNMHARARQQSSRAPSPMMPASRPLIASDKPAARTAVDGGMF